MKFVVDAMLGKVALWLRLTGHDTIYSGDIEDDTALAIAEEESRALLTSDEELFQRANNRKLNAMLVRGTVDEKVASVFCWYDINPDINPSVARCSKCNGKLEEITSDTKARVKDLVFEQTYNSYNTFWLCNDCNSVFFQGGYWNNMTQYMERIKEVMKNLKC